MSMINTIIRGVFWNTIGASISKVVVLVNIFYIVSHLSVYEYGLTELIFSVTTVLGIFLLPGIFDTIVTDMSVERGRNNPGRMKGIFIQFVKLQTVLCIIAWACVFLIAPIIGHLSGNESISYFLRIISFSFLVAPARAVVTMLSLVTVRFVDQSLFSTVEELGKLMFLILFLDVLALGPAGLLYSVVLAPCVSVLFYVPRTISAYKQFGGVGAVYTHRWWQLVYEHRKWSIGTTYLGSLGSAFRLWIIRLMLGTEAVGLFAFAYGILGNIAGLMPLTPVLKPIIPQYVDKIASLIRLVGGAFKIQILNALLFIVIGVLTLPPFIHYVFPQYSGAISLVLVVLLAILPSSIGSVMIPVFAAFKEQRSFFFATVFKVCVGTVLLPVLIFFFGLLGVGVEIFLTLFISAIERYRRLSRLIPGFSLNLKTLFTFDEVEKILIQTFLKKFFKKK